MVIKARYENGVFRPLEAVPVREGTIAEVYLPEESKGEKRPWKSVKDSPVYGIWKDRDDIGTGEDYVKRIRKYRRVE